MKDKTVIWIMFVFTILIVCGIGYYIGITMVDEIENHPEITDIGAPPRLENMVLVVSVVAIVCGICLMLPVKEEDENENM